LYGEMSNRGNHMTRLKTPRKGGHPRVYDRSQIVAGFIAHKSNKEIAVEVGCSYEWVRELRQKWEWSKRRCQTLR